MPNGQLPFILQGSEHRVQASRSLGLVDQPEGNKPTVLLGGEQTWRRMPSARAGNAGIPQRVDSPRWAQRHRRSKNMCPRVNESCGTYAISALQNKGEKPLHGQGHWGTTHHPGAVFKTPLHP